MCSIGARAQLSVKDLFGHAVFQSYAMKDGLTSNYCYDVLQDTRGVIWVATLNGLNSFNGTKWESFQQQSSQTKHRLPANWVMDIDEERGKGIWVNTDRGIAFFDFSTSRMTTFRQPIKGWGKLISMGRNRIVVSSWTGLERFQRHKSKLKSQQHYPQSANNSFPLIYRGHFGSIWTCPEDHPCLIQLDEKTGRMEYISQIFINGKAVQPIIQGILQTNQHTLLLATKSHGILRYSIKTKTATPLLPQLFPTKFNYAPLKFLYIKNKCYLVVGTKGEGLIVADLKTRTAVQLKHNDFNPTSLCSNEITNLCADNNEGLWVSTTMGLSYFHPSLQKNKRFYFHNRLASGNGLQINTIYPINESWYLIGTDADGLFLYDTRNDDLKVVSCPASQISIIRKTPLGILIGSNKGVFLWDSIKRSVAKQPLTKKQTLNIRALNSDFTALCTFEGLVILNKKGDIHQQESQSVHLEKLMCKDALLINNQLWILRFFDGWEIRSFSSNDLLYHSRSFQLNLPIDYHGMSASKEAVYIATSAGIIRQDIRHLNRVKRLVTKDGLIGDEIENVLVANNNKFYYTTVDGLYLYQIPQHKSRRLLSYENYIQKWYNQLEWSSNKTVLYSVSDHFCTYSPNSQFFNEKTPRLQPESIWVNAKLRKLSNPLQLSYLTNNVHIQFGACVFPEASKNRWKYRLTSTGASNQPWEESTGDIVLQNLPAKDYVLEYFSVNNEGKSSSKRFKMFLSISPPFYETGWFIFVVFIIILGLSFFFYSYKRYQNKRLDRIRNQISRDLHDELGANVSSIHIMANMLQQRPDSPQAPTALANISRYSVQISDTINDIIWNVNPKFDSLDELVKRMTRYASETIEGAQIDYSIHIPNHVPILKLDNQTKYHLYLIFKESINNTVKHSRAKNIQVTFGFNGKQFQFQVKDDGVGYELGKKAIGNGLTNLYQRAKEIHAQLSMETALEKGTVVTLRIQLS